MANYKLTPGNDTVSGASGDDLIEAFFDEANRQSTLTAGDAIRGGGGDDTLVLEGSYAAGTPVNVAIQGNISGIESLVLVGDFAARDSGEAGLTAVNVGLIGGLQTIRLENAATYGLTTEASTETDVWLSHVGGHQSVVLDNLIGQATIDYNASAVSADLAVAAKGYIALFTIAGKNLTTLDLDVQGNHDTLVDFGVDTHGGGAAKVTTLNIDAERGRAVVFDGFFGPFVTAILNAHQPSGDQFGYDGPPGFATLKTVTVTGKGGGWIDLSANTANVTFTGSAGDDAVLVDPDNTDARDHFDGGRGTDIFAVTLLDTPAKQKTLTLTAAAYAAFDAAKNFEEAGFIGDFERTLVINAAQIAQYKTLIVGQDAQFSKLADDQTVLYQITGFAAIHDSHFVLDHAVDSKGHMTGTGTVTVQGGDILQTGVLLGKLLGGTGLYKKPSGLAIIDNASRYASLDLTGTFDAEIKSAATWTDAKGATHGVTIDGSQLNGTMKVANGSTLADTIIGTAGSDTLDGGLGSDILTGSGGKNRFEFDTALSKGNIDTITDFTAATDTIVLDHAVFAGLTVGAAPTFATGTKATGAADHLFYNGATGALFYDRDGSGTAHQAQQVAQLGAGLHLTAGHFQVV